MQQEIKILVAGLSKLNIAQKYDKHLHPFYQLNHLVQGKYRYIVDDQEYIVSAGDTILIPVNSEHSFIEIGEKTGYYFEVKFSSFSKGVKEMCSDIGILVQNDDFSGKLFKEIFDEKNNSTQESADIMVTYLYSILFKLSARARREKHTPSKYIEVSAYSATVRETIRFLEDHYKEPLSLDDIVAKTPLKKSYLSSLFKRETTVTIFECLMIIRVRKAVELLSFTNMSLTQVSKDIGFINTTHFNRVFTKYVMIPPGQYRKYLKSQHIYWNDASTHPIAAAILGGSKIDFSHMSDHPE